MISWKLSLSSKCGPRTENQDNYLVINAQGEYQHLCNEQPQQGIVKPWQTDHIRIAVADGMGGHLQGREFTETVIERLLTMPFQCQPQQLQAQLESLHQQLFKQYFQDSRAPGCTLVMADITPTGHVLLANIGDSRAYLLEGKQSAKDDGQAIGKQLTYDHTEDEFAWRNGLINDVELQTLQAEQKSKLAQALGFGHIELTLNHSVLRKQHRADLALQLTGKHPDMLSFQLQVGQSLLLASDGYWDKTSKDNATLLKLTYKQLNTG